MRYQGICILYYYYFFFAGIFAPVFIYLLTVLGFLAIKFQVLHYITNLHSATVLCGQNSCNNE